MKKILSSTFFAMTLLGLTLAASFNLRAEDADHWVVHQRPDLVTEVITAALES